MITNLHLQNFKSHKDTNLRIKPLTLITGVNNCGKSSVLHSMLALRQTYRAGHLDDGLELNKSLVSIGVGNDVLYRFAAEPMLRISLEIDGMQHDFSFNAGDALGASYIPRIKMSADTLKDMKLNDCSLFNNNFQYLSSYRKGGTSAFPLATYEVNVEHQVSLEKGQGELVGNFLFAFKGLQTYNYIEPGAEPLSLLDQVVYWESLISSGITIDVQQTQDKTGFNIIYGRQGTNSKKSLENLRAENIGYGVSHSLPVITALLAAQPGSLLLIENPEVYLHTEGQSHLATLISRVAQRGVQIIIETHSDHIVNGVLVNEKKFAKGESGIDKNNVIIYYLSGCDTDHVVQYEEVKVEPDFRLEYQPIGFFDTIEKDINYLLE